VHQGLSAGWSLDTLVVAERALTRDYVSDLVDAAQTREASILTVPDRVMAKIARKDNPNAVLGAFQQNLTPLDGLDRTRSSRWLALYEVRDPGNLGTILRTADCAGIGGVILVETCCDPFSLEAVRASMGSIFDVAMSQTSFAAFDTWRRTAGLSLMAGTSN
ncbi:MAG: TrmH family RNA methyltransferase, partial [Bacteroidota bacterium]